MPADIKFAVSLKDNVDKMSAVGPLSAHRGCHDSYEDDKEIESDIRPHHESFFILFQWLCQRVSLLPALLCFGNFYFHPHRSHTNPQSFLLIFSPIRPTFDFSPCSGFCQSARAGCLILALFHESVCEGVTRDRTLRKFSPQNLAQDDQQESVPDN
jgi:hypothetical protein